LLRFLPTVFQGLTLAYQALNNTDSDSDDCNNGPPDYYNRPSEQNAHGDSTATFATDAEEFHHSFDHLLYGMRVGPATSNFRVLHLLYDSNSDRDCIPSLLEESNDSDSGSDTYSSAPTIPFFRVSDTAVNDYPLDRFIDHLCSDLRQNDQFVNPYDYSPHFTPLSMAARSQRIERNVFDSAHRGRYVVTVSVFIRLKLYPPSDRTISLFFLDPTEHDLTNVFTVMADKFGRQSEHLRV
jgi:hypothetical protein